MSVLSSFSSFQLCIHVFCLFSPLNSAFLDRFDLHKAIICYIVHETILTKTELIIGVITLTM